MTGFLSFYSTCPFFKEKQLAGNLTLKLASMLMQGSFD
jgi:hypothetical protein